MTIVKKITGFLKREFRYLYLKHLPPRKYPDFLKKEYKKQVGETLNLENPEKYTEKMQYAKLHLNHPLKTKLSDKYLVREWVEETIGSDYLIPLLGVWDNFDEINFDELPEKFVLKTNHSSGWNLIVTDKNEIDYDNANRLFTKYVNRNYAYHNDLQLQYIGIKPKIIAEKFLQDSKGELRDYKFMCFNGEPYYCWLDVGRFSDQYRNIYDIDWNLQTWNYNVFENYPAPLPKPENYDEMVELARKMSQGFSHVRVDLYNIDGKIYFGEMTFTSSGGYTKPHPESYNKYLGDLWDLENGI